MPKMKSYGLALILALLPAVARAQVTSSYYNLTPISGGPAGTQRVVTNPVLHIPNDCINQPFCGTLAFASLHVVPCPVARPCVGGAYDRSFGANFFSERDTLDLLIGTQYSFSGSWYIEKYGFDPFIGGCFAFLCSYGENYQPVVYPAATPTLSTSWGRLKVRYR